MPGANQFFYLQKNLVERLKGVNLPQGLGCFHQPVNDMNRLVVYQGGKNQLLHRLVVQESWVKMS
jgi:hypothetical protein